MHGRGALAVMVMFLGALHLGALAAVVLFFSWGWLLASVLAWQVFAGTLRPQ